MNNSTYRYYVSTCIPIGGTPEKGITCEVINSNGETCCHKVNSNEFNVIAAAYQDIIGEDKLLSLIKTYQEESIEYTYHQIDRIIGILVNRGLMACGEGGTKQEAVDNLARKVFFCPIALTTVLGLPVSMRLLAKAFLNSVKSLFLPSQIRNVYQYLVKAPDNTIGRYFEACSSNERFTEGIAACVLLAGGYILPCGYQKTNCLNPMHKI